MDQLIWALEQTLNPDQQQLDASVRYLEAWADASFAWLAGGLTALAAGDAAAPATVSTAVRRQAAIQLKNLLRRDSGNGWRQLNCNQREQTKTVLLDGLLGRSSTTGGSYNSSGLPQCIQAVAELELPAGVWPELIPQLVAAVVAKDNSAPVVVASCLETLGYICETVSPACLEADVNQLLTAIVYGMKTATFTAADINLVAVTALTNALELATMNFARVAERNYIMQVRDTTTKNIWR